MKRPRKPVGAKLVTEAGRRWLAALAVTGALGNIAPLGAAGDYRASYDELLRVRREAVGPRPLPDLWLDEPRRHDEPPRPPDGDGARDPWVYQRLRELIELANSDLPHAEEDAARVMGAILGRQPMLSGEPIEVLERLGLALLRTWPGVI